MVDTIECIKVSMQLYLEKPNTHDIEKENIYHLCSAFSFWYTTFIQDDYTLYADVYFPSNNYIFLSDFNNIIKTFAIFHGYGILNSEIIEMPYSDLTCLDSTDKEN